MEKKKKKLKTAGSFVRGDARINRHGKPPKDGAKVMDWVREHFGVEGVARAYTKKIKAGNTHVILDAVARIDGKVRDSVSVDGINFDITVLNGIPIDERRRILQEVEDEIERRRKAIQLPEHGGSEPRSFPAARKQIDRHTGSRRKSS